MILQTLNSIQLHQSFDESQLALLSQLCDDGFIEKFDGYYEIPKANFFQLDEFTRQWLDFPEVFSGKARIRLEGPGISFDTSLMKVDFYNNIGGFESLSIEGFFLKKDDEFAYVVPEYLSDALVKLDEYNSLKSKKEENQGFLKFAQLKKLCSHDHIILDTLLLNQDVIYPERLKLNVNVNQIDETITISPSVEGQEEFTEKFEKKSIVKDHYFYRNSSGKKTRVLFGEGNSNVSHELKKIKEKRVYRNDEIKTLVENSSQLFNSDVLDLSDLFGERVLGMEVFLPPSLPVINKIGSNWVPGFKVSEEYVFICDTYEYDLLSSSYELALKAEMKTVYFKGKNFSIDSVMSVLRVSKLIFEDKKELSEEDLESNFKEFLVVKDNVEELEFLTLSEEEVIENFSLLKATSFDSKFKLKQHQVEGIAWLQALFIQLKSSGVLLADDMGLGKTLQILYFLESLVDHIIDEKRPALIICPSSLIENWAEEYQRFFTNPSYDTVTLKGNVVSYLNDIRKGRFNGRRQLCLTTYETMRINAVGFCSVQWGVIAFDEAQKVKNPAALVTHSAKGLKSMFKIAMTGTPVENSWLDLWCLMDLCAPGILGSARLFNQKTKSKKLDENGIREVISTKFLRRLKSDVAKDLPEKHEYFDESQECSGKQLSMYMNVLNQLSNLKENDLLKGTSMLTAIHEMKSIADHPELVRRDQDFDMEALEKSAKIQITLRLLKKIESKNEKVIVFTEKRKMQFIIKQIIKNHFGISADIVNGEVPSTSNYNDTRLTRQKLVDNFQNVLGFNIIIMSPLSAGFGLNVVGANHVIHYSRHWNPAKEQQATDRVYRIGQKKDVHIYYPMATLPNGLKSFDQILHDRLKKKKELSDNVMFPSEKIVVSNQDILDDLIF